MILSLLWIEEINDSPDVVCLLEGHHQKQNFPPSQNGSVRVDVAHRADRNTKVTANPIPSVNTMCHVPNCPPIAVSLFLLALLVSYFK